MDSKERLKAALLALRAAQDMLQDTRRGTTDAEVIHGDEPESDKVIGPT